MVWGEVPVFSVDWIDRLRDARSPDGPPMKALKLYREFKVTTAGKAWRDHDYYSAVAEFKQAAQASVEFGDTDRAMRLLEKGEIARNQRDKRTEDKGNYERYLFTLQAKLNKAFNERDLGLARDLLKQMVVISKSMKDADLLKAYKEQLVSVEGIYKGKGTRSVNLQKIMRSRFIDSLNQATLRAGLSFKQQYPEQVKVLTPICAHL